MTIFVSFVLYIIAAAICSANAIWAVRVLDSIPDRASRSIKIRRQRPVIFGSLGMTALAAALVVTAVHPLM